MNVPQLIELAIQTPLKAFVLSVPDILFLQFFSDFLWVFGMHGSSILAPIRQAPLLQSIQENMDAFSVGKEIPNIITVLYQCIWIDWRWRVYFTVSYCYLVGF